MTTLDDQASDLEERQLDAALSVRKQTGPAPCGKCLNCGDPLEGEARWCDKSCAEDWEYFTGREAINRGPSE